MRYPRLRFGSGVEVDGVRLGGREEEGRVRAGGCGIPSMVRYGFAELDALRLGCELRWDFGGPESPTRGRWACRGPVVETVHGELGGGLEDGRFGAFGVDVAGRGRVDEGGIEETV